MTGLNDEHGSMELEDQVVARLRAERLIAPRSTRGPFLVLLAATAAIMVLLHGQQQELAGRVYILALYSGEEYDAPKPSDHDARAHEYGAWARAHRDGAAAVIGGDELEPAVATLGPSQPRSNSELVGFFRLRARTSADALTLAKTTPHLRYGGAVTIWPTAR